VFSEVVECSVKTCQVEAGQCSTDAALSTQTYQGFYGDFTQMGVLSDLLPTLTFQKCVVSISVLLSSESPANAQQKTETLIFITPRILSDTLVN